MCRFAFEAQYNKTQSKTADLAIPMPPSGELDEAYSVVFDSAYCFHYMKT